MTWYGLCRDSAASGSRSRCDLAVGVVACLVGGALAAAPGRAAADWLETAQERFERLNIDATLAFTARVDGNRDLYSVGPDGAKRLTTDPAVDEWPVWSPDGRRIAFESDRDGNQEIHTWSRSGYRRLTRHMGFDGCPVWSPDGRTILFYSDREGGQESELSRLSLFSMNADGENVRPFKVAGLNLGVGTPSWSPDGRRLAIDGSERSDGDTIGVKKRPADEPLFGDKFLTDIYTVRPDGTAVKPLTSGDHVDMTAAWSPDGRQIAFASNRCYSKEDGRLEIYIMAADGTGIRRLTNLKMQSLCPAWSPDGKWLAFHGATVTDHPDDRTYGFFLVRTDGSQVVRLTDPDRECYVAAWRPNRGTAQP